MKTLTRAALAAATLTLAVAPTAHAALPSPPPTDVIDLGIKNGCEGSQDPCDPVITGPHPTVDKTYPSRLVAWAESVLP